MITLSTAYVNTKIGGRGTFSVPCNDPGTVERLLSVVQFDCEAGTPETIYSLGENEGKANYIHISDNLVVNAGLSGYVKLMESGGLPDAQAMNVLISRVLAIMLEVLSPDYGTDPTQFVTVTSVGLAGPPYGWTNGPIGTITIPCPGRVLFVRPPGKYGWTATATNGSLKVTNNTALAATVRVAVIGHGAHT